MPKGSQWKVVCMWGGVPCPEIYQVCLMSTDLTDLYTIGMLRIHAPVSNYTLSRCGVWHFTSKYSFFYPSFLPLKWKLSLWFVQNIKLIHIAKYSKVVIGFVFQWLKETSRAGRTLNFICVGWRGGLLKRWGESTERGEEGQWARISPTWEFWIGLILPTQYCFKIKQILFLHREMHTTHLWELL